MKRHVTLIFGYTTHWTAMFLRPGFEHVQIITKEENGTILYFNPSKDWLDLMSLTIEERQKIINQFVGKRKILTLEVNYEPNEQFLRPRIFTCVGLAKYICALKMFGLTPYSLYRKLIKYKDKNKFPKNIRSIKEIRG